MKCYKLMKHENSFNSIVTPPKHMLYLNTIIAILIANPNEKLVSILQKDLGLRLLGVINFSLGLATSANHALRLLWS